MSVGDAIIHELVTTERMKRLDPSNTLTPSQIPLRSAPSLALKLANMSGAPAPNANKVTPARDSDSLNVLEIYQSEGLKCSSATKDKQKKAKTMLKNQLSKLIL